MNRNKNPLVSVVVPMYNVSDYIETCIQSILGQTFHNFEVICVDDGCTDDTLAKLAQFDDPRITLVRQKNAGLSAARNTGIWASNGLYIAFLDSDDFWHKHKLATHVKHLSMNPNVAVSYSPSLFVNNQGKPLGIGQYPKISGVTLRDVMCRNPVGNGSAPVIRKSTLLSHVQVNKDTGKRQIFNESLRQSEDIELWLRIALRTPMAFAGVEQPLTYYRVNESGLSANIPKQYKAWHNAIWQVVKYHPTASQLFTQARAYQLRYLARRAIQSGERWTAFKLINKALCCNPKILVQEPGRTLLTYACAVLRFLPQSIYTQLETSAQLFASSRKLQAVSQ